MLLYNIYLGIVLYIYCISLTNNNNYKTNLDKVIPSFALEYQISVKSLPTTRVLVFNFRVVLLRISFSHLKNHRETFICTLCSFLKIYFGKVFDLF